MVFLLFRAASGVAMACSSELGPKASGGALQNLIAGPLEPGESVPLSPVWPATSITRSADLVFGASGIRLFGLFKE